MAKRSYRKSPKQIRRSIRSLNKRISRLSEKLGKKRTSRKSKSKRCRKGFFSIRKLLKSGKLSKRKSCVPLFLKSPKTKPTMKECHCHAKRKHCTPNNICHYHPGKCHCKKVSVKRSMFNLPRAAYKSPALMETKAYYDSEEYLNQPFNLPALGFRVKYIRKGKKHSYKKSGSKKKSGRTMAQIRAAASAKRHKKRMERKARFRSRVRRSRERG